MGDYIGSSSEFGKQLNYFAKEYRLWAEQMAHNEQIKFKPFDFTKEKIDELLCVNEKSLIQRALKTQCRWR